MDLGKWEFSWDVIVSIIGELEELVFEGTNA